jgi:hypothetical protein
MPRTLKTMTVTAAPATSGLTRRALSIVPFSAFMKATCSAALLCYEVLYCYVSRCGFLSLIRSGPFGPSWADSGKRRASVPFTNAFMGMVAERWE